VVRLAEFVEACLHFLSGSRFVNAGASSEMAFQICLPAAFSVCRTRRRSCNYASIRGAYLIDEIAWLWCLEGLDLDENELGNRVPTNE
jgi:hypothetical protein